MSVLDRGREHVLALFRMVVGFLFACHGAATLFGLLGKKTAELGAWPGWWAAVIQLVGGALVALGVATRIAAVVGSGSMAYAYFVVHQTKGLLPMENGGELSALFCWALFLIAFTGPGAWALGRALRPVVQSSTAPRAEPELVG